MPYKKRSIWLYERKCLYKGIMDYAVFSSEHLALEYLDSILSSKDAFGEYTLDDEDHVLTRTEPDGSHIIKKARINERLEASA